MDFLLFYINQSSLSVKRRLLLKKKLYNTFQVAMKTIDIKEEHESSIRVFRGDS